MAHQRQEAETDLPKCDWVYFAAPSKGSATVAEVFVERARLIIRNVHDKAGQRLPNNARLRPGQRILLVYGEKGSFHALLCCTIVASTKPVKTPRPSFDIFREIDKSDEHRLIETSYEADPVLNKFTGISVAEVQNLRHITRPIPRPQGRSTLRRWDEVPWNLDSKP